MVMAMVRPLSLVFCHAVWAGMFAYFLARASLFRRSWGALFIVGLCVSAFLHGTYDWFDNLQPSVSAIIAAVSFMLFYAYVAKLRTAIAGPDKPELVAEVVVPADA
jgi:RsiW-degrading membrane proteinase PrsW (M82 family)